MIAHGSDALQRATDRVASARLVKSNNAGTRLQRVSNEALTFGRHFARVTCLSKSGSYRLFIARLEFEGQVSGDLRMKLGRAIPDRVLETRHGGKIAVLDVYELACIFRNRCRVRDNHRHRLANEPHAIHREHRVEGLAQFLAAFAREVQDIR